MARKSAYSDQQPLFRHEAPKMLEGYYSGDKPNPNLRAFVEAHLRERSYDPETDDYDVPAFNEPITTTKATAIYNMHTYWSKKPHDAIRQYIRHYTIPGDLVLDPFCGSGGTALAALMEGRKAIAIDRSPAATFITKNYCTPVDVDELRRAFEELEAKVKPEIDWLYETRCDRCGGKATTAYTVYSQVFQCPRCMERIPLFDCEEVEGKTSQGKPRKVDVCPYCHKRGIEEEISTRSERFGEVPVLVSYLCQNGCKPVRGERRHNDSERKKRECFRKYDLGKLNEIEVKDIPHWYPPDRMMHVEDDSSPWGVKWRAGTSSFRTVAELFTKRNLWALAAIRDGISDLPGDVADPILFAFSGILLGMSRMNRHRPNVSYPTNIMEGTYYIPQNMEETVPWHHFQNKFGKILKACVQLPYDLQETRFCTSTQSATDLRTLLSDSLDYIFTDPPYAGNVQYGELNFVWEAWLGFDTHWHDEEIIVNEVRGKTEEDWARMMRQAMAECYRVLKPGRWLSLCYHDTSEGTWALVQDIMADVGFEVDQSDAALFIDTGQKSYNQLTADKVNKRDLVINFRKPKSGQRFFIMGTEDEATFSEKVLGVIREYLSAHPGATKDHVYDDVVSRMVRKGQMEAHDFDGLLSLVADEVREPRKKDLFENEDPDLFGTHEVSRWYLKDTEIGAEESDHAVADQAAAKVEQFVIKQSEAELKRTQEQWDELNQKANRLKDDLDRPFTEEEKRKRAKLLKELEQAEAEIARLKAERDEWTQHALHYTYISEHYFPLTPKPRCTLVEMLEDYFIQTDEGNWRPPATDEERQEKAAGRARAVRRVLQRFCKALQSGEAIPSASRPDAATIAEWIRHCKRSGLYELGKLLYEKGGMNVERLPEEAAVNVEEDYMVCCRMLQRNAPVKKRT